MARMNDYHSQRVREIKARLAIAGSAAPSEERTAAVRQLAFTEYPLAPAPVGAVAAKKRST
jgi:hypothetical protein